MDSHLKLEQNPVYCMDVFLRICRFVQALGRPIDFERPSVLKATSENMKNRARSLHPRIWLFWEYRTIVFFKYLSIRRGHVHNFDLHPTCNKIGESPEDFWKSFAKMAEFLKNIYGEKVSTRLISLNRSSFM